MASGCFSPSYLDSITTRHVSPFVVLSANNFPQFSYWSTFVKERSDWSKTLLTYDVHPSSYEDVIRSTLSFSFSRFPGQRTNSNKRSLLVSHIKLCIFFLFSH